MRKEAEQACGHEEEGGASIANLAVEKQVTKVGAYLWEHVEVLFIIGRLNELATCRCFC